MSSRKAEKPGKRHLMSWQQEKCATVHSDDDLTMTRGREEAGRLEGVGEGGGCYPYKVLNCAAGKVANRVKGN